MSESHEIDVDLQFSLVWLTWAWSDNFQHALSDDFCLAHSDHNLPIFSSKPDLIDEPKALLPVLLHKILLPQEPGLFGRPGIGSTVKLNRFEKEVSLILAQTLKHFLQSK